MSTFYELEQEFPLKLGAMLRISDTDARNLSYVIVRDAGSKKTMIRIPGPGSLVLDELDGRETKDIFGYAETLSLATEDACRKYFDAAANELRFRAIFDGPITGTIQ